MADAGENRQEAQSRSDETDSISIEEANLLLALKGETPELNSGERTTKKEDEDAHDQDNSQKQRPITIGSIPSTNVNKGNQKRMDVSREKVCNFFLEGQCRFGRECRSKHSQELLEKNRMIICKPFQIGACMYGSHCKFQHKERERYPESESSRPKKMAITIPEFGFGGERREMPENQNVVVNAHRYQQNLEWINRDFESLKRLQEQIMMQMRDAQQNLQTLFARIEDLAWNAPENYLPEDEQEGEEGPMEAIKEESLKEECKDESNDLKVRLGEEERKVKKLTAKLIDLGIDVNKILEDSASGSLGGSAPSTSLSDTYMARLLSPPPATTPPLPSYLSKHHSPVSKLNIKPNQKAKEQQKQDDEYKQMRQFRGEEVTLQVRKAKSNKKVKKVSVSTDPIEPIQPKETLIWPELSLCTDPASISSSLKKKPRLKTMSASPEGAHKTLNLPFKVSVAGEEKKRAQAMDPQQTEVSQQFERSNEAFAKKDYNSCSELKVLPTKFTNVAQELTNAKVSPRPVIHASQRKESEKTDNKKSLASTSKSGVKPEVVGCVDQTKKSGGFTLDFESQPVTKETLSQELDAYLRLQHEFIQLKLEQISMEVSPEEKEKQKKFLDGVKKSVNDSIRDVLKDSENEQNLVTLVEVVKAGRKRTEEHICRVKNENEKAKKKEEKDAKKKEK